MNAYEQKQVNKLARYERAAQLTQAASDAAYDQAHKMSSVIPFGQPILVGHHSERGHRNYMDKIHRRMGKAVELAEKAKEYQRRIMAIKNNRTISSDDPDAAIKLKEKISELETNHKAMLIRDHARFEVTNSGANIRRLKQRLELLEKKQARPELKPQEINGIRIEENKELNRIQIFFPAIPSEEKRTKLKSNGFRWSPTQGAWQRHTSQYALDLARAIAWGQ